MIDIHAKENNLYFRARIWYDLIGVVIDNKPIKPEILIIGN